MLGMILSSNKLCLIVDQNAYNIHIYIIANFILLDVFIILYDCYYILILLLLYLIYEYISFLSITRKNTIEFGSKAILNKLSIIIHTI